MFQWATPFFLEADTKEELIVLMKELQFSHRRKYHFFDFQFVRGKWICWYELPLSVENEEKLKGNVDG